MNSTIVTRYSLRCPARQYRARVALRAWVEELHEERRLRMRRELLRKFESLPFEKKTEVLASSLCLVLKNLKRAPLGVGVG